MNKNEDLFFLIKHLSKCIELSIDKEAANLSLTPQQGRLLLFLNRKEKENIKVRQMDIEQRFQLSKSTVSGLIKRMEIKNLIYKKKEQGNIYIYTSKEGQRVLTLFRQKLEEIKKNNEQYLNKEEKEHLILLLNKIYKGIKKEDE